MSIVIFGKKVRGHVARCPGSGVVDYQQLPSDCSCTLVTHEFRDNEAASWEFHRASPFLLFSITSSKDARGQRLVAAAEKR